jgi:HSP20 family molecular chaperone IbpA
MGSMKLDLRSAPANFQQTVEQFYRAAFGPSPSLYRQLSFCGWRPLTDHRTQHEALLSNRAVNQPSASMENASCIAIHETDDSITIEVALASIKEDSLHLAIAGKMVIIRGELRLAGQQTEPMIPDKRGKSVFQRIIQLPTNVNAGGFRAQLVDDIVQINFAKRN